MAPDRSGWGPGGTPYLLGNWFCGGLTQKGSRVLQGSEPSGGLEIHFLGIDSGWLVSTWGKEKCKHVTLAEGVMFEISISEWVCLWLSTTSWDSTKSIHLRWRKQLSSGLQAAEVVGGWKVGRYQPAWTLSRHGILVFTPSTWIKSTNHQESLFLLQSSRCVMERWFRPPAAGSFRFTSHFFGTSPGSSASSSAWGDLHRWGCRAIVDLATPPHFTSSQWGSFSSIGSSSSDLRWQLLDEEQVRPHSQTNSWRNLSSESSCHSAVAMTQQNLGWRPWVQVLAIP